MSWQVRLRYVNELSGLSRNTVQVFVVERHRGRGIGTELVRAGMNVAWEQGFGRIYTATVTATGILERLGWKQVKVISDGDEQSVLFLHELEQRNSIDGRFHNHKL